MDVKNYKCINCGSDIFFEPNSKKWYCKDCRSYFTKSELDEFFYNKEESTSKKDHQVDGSISYYCENCGGDIVVDAGTTSTVCPYCKQTSVVKSNVKKDSEIKEESISADNIQTDDLNSYNCQNCGGEIVADDETVATFCPYCKSPSIIKSKMTGEFNPKLLVPFRKTEKDAKELYNEWIKKKIYTPSNFKNKETIDEIKGLYAPFWLYDIHIEGGLRGVATRVTTWSDSEYNYTKTDYYNIVREGDNYYDKVPADAASKLDDNMMNHIEPFDYGELTDFELPYMAGFFAERYDVSCDECAVPAKKKAESYFESRLSNTVSGYNSFSITSRNFSYKKIDSNYAMLPIYYLVNYYNEEKRAFIMNGQTGKLYGNPPISPLLVLRMFVLAFIVSFIIVLLGAGVVYG